MDGFIDALCRASGTHEATPAGLDLEALLSPHQRTRILSTARFRAIPAGRQSGKTDGIEKLLLAVASDPASRGMQVVYVSTTIKRAISTVWDELVLFNDEMGLGGRVNINTHTIKFPGGGKLVITGCEDKRMANNIRGWKKVRLYAIDEAQDWPDELLRYFYEKVVYPSLTAVRGGVIVAGTGGPPHGWWYEVATGMPGRNGQSAGTSFTRFGPWTPYDNPFLPPGEAEALVLKACQDRGVDINDPSIQTEFFCAFVADLNRQIFHYDAKRNGFNRGTWNHAAGWWEGGDLPAGNWSVIIASDAGTVDAAAWSAIGWCDTDPRFWLLETDKQHALGSSAQMQMARLAHERYGRRVVKAIMDPGGGGKGLIVDLNQEHLQGTDPALKVNKAAGCVIMRDGLRTAKLMVATAEAEFIQELGMPEWDPSAIGTVIRGHFPDRVDAALYGYRDAVKMHHYQPKVVAPKYEMGLPAPRNW